MEVEEDVLQTFKDSLIQLNSLLELSIQKEEESLNSIIENREGMLTLIKLMKDYNARK